MTGRFPDLVPRLSDGVVTLRAHVPDDLDAMVEQVVDPLSQEWTTVPRVYGPAQARERLEHVRTQWELAGGERSWAIESAQGVGPSRYAGTIDVRPQPGGVGSLGYILHPKARGHGTMARAIRLVAAHAFTTGVGDGPLHRLHWEAAVGNFGSLKAAQDAGITVHAVLPQHRVSYPRADGTFVVKDHWVGSLAADEPTERRTPWLLNPPVLEGYRIRLRPLRDSDINGVEVADHPTHWIPDYATPTKENFGAFLLRHRRNGAEGSTLTWAVADRHTDAFLGYVTVFTRLGSMTGDVAELGYLLVPSAQGRGLAVEASALARDYVFAAPEDGGLGLRRLVAETASDNEASNRTLRKLGFTAYGQEHEVDLLPDGSFGHGTHWELIRR